VLIRMLLRILINAFFGISSLVTPPALIYRYNTDCFKDKSLNHKISSFSFTGISYF
jgi:hypothetical protein